MINHPVISVVMSVYNGGQYLDDSIQSILRQSYKNFEFIIIDDGSTDDSWLVIQKYTKQDSRIVAITQKNVGLTKSLNIGISLSNGTYIARMDADDISSPERFYTQLKWMDSNHYDLCCCRTWMIEEKRVSPGLSYYIPNKVQLSFRNPFIHGTFLISKSSLEKIGGYDELFLYAQDYKLIYDFYRHGFKIKYLRDHLYSTRRPSDSIGVKKSELQNRFAQKVKKLFRNNMINITC